MLAGRQQNVLTSCDAELLVSFCFSLQYCWFSNSAETCAGFLERLEHMVLALKFHYSVCFVPTKVALLLLHGLFSELE